MNQNNSIITIIKNKLFWVSDELPPTNLANSSYFNIDKVLEYEPFYRDFGPLNLGLTWQYATKIQKLLNSLQANNLHIIHHTSTDFGKRANSAYLMAAYLIIIKGYSAERAFQPFKDLNLTPFRDASYGQCSYHCTLLDCLKGLQYAIRLGWFQYKTFNIAEYEHYERVQNGDLNWIIPKKFIAFSSPNDQTVDRYGNKLFSPKDYIPIFKQLGVTMVIRLNNKTYDSQAFIKEGIKHHDLIFPDGTAPNQQIVEEFLKITQSQPGAIAVHCKAGLGRTGSLIACYAMKHYQFPAADFIAWIRICRPGSILGPQQHFLINCQKTMKQKGQKSQIWKSISATMNQKQIAEKLKSLSIKNNVMSERESEIMHKGEHGQGQYLQEAKNNRNQKQNLDKMKNKGEQKKQKK